MRAFLKKFWLKTKIALKEFYLKNEDGLWILLVITVLQFVAIAGITISYFDWKSWKDWRHIFIIIGGLWLGLLILSLVIHMTQTVIKRIKNKWMEKKRINYYDEIDCLLKKTAKDILKNKKKIEKKYFFYNSEQDFLRKRIEKNTIINIYEDFVKRITEDIKKERMERETIIYDSQKEFLKRITEELRRNNEKTQNKTTTNTKNK